MASSNPSDGSDHPSENEGSVKDNILSQEANFNKLCNAIKTIVECIDEEPDRPGLLETPRRYAQALLDLTSGNKLEVEKVVGNALFRQGHFDMVVVKDIEVHSLCEHHLLPFSGKIHIAYMPCSTIIGLSKLARIVDMFSRQLQNQERLTAQVAQDVGPNVLGAKGVAFVMEASHMCIVMRGVEKTGSTTVTSSFTGCFDEKLQLRNEFLGYVGAPKK